MSRSLRKIQRGNQALKALRPQAIEAFNLLSKSLNEVQGGIKEVVKLAAQVDQPVKVALLDPPVGQPTSFQQLLDALVEDVEVLARENAVLRETFLRLLIALSEDTEENIREVEATIRGQVEKEHT